METAISEPAVTDIVPPPAKREKRELSEEQKSKLKDRMDKINASKRAEKDEKKAIQKRLEDLEMERSRQKIVEAELAVEDAKKSIETKLTKTAVYHTTVTEPVQEKVLTAPPPPPVDAKETPYDRRMRLTREALLRSMGLLT